MSVALTEGLGTGAGAQVDILFDTAALSFTSCSIPLLQNHEVVTSLPSSPAAPPGKTRARVIIKPVNGEPVEVFDEGLLAWCNFFVKTDAPVGDSHLLTDHAFGSDAAGNDLPTSAIGGKVTITSSCGGGGGC